MTADDVKRAATLIEAEAPKWGQQVPTPWDKALIEKVRRYAFTQISRNAYASDETRRDSQAVADDIAVFATRAVLEAMNEVNPGCLRHERRDRDH